MRGDGSVYLRRGRVWWIQYRAAGRRYFESANTTDEVKARELLRQRTANKRFNVELLAAIGGQSMGVLSGEEVIALRGPLVYAWKRGQHVLYVGKGETGMARALHPRHHKLRGILPTDQLHFWRCATAEEACRLEATLIESLEPSRNGRAELATTPFEDYPEAYARPVDAAGDRLSGSSAFFDRV